LNPINLAMLVKMTGIVPKGLFIENVIRVGRDELKGRCNYWNELANQESFQALVEADPVVTTGLSYQMFGRI
jgi:aarF domain-containing kinase